MAIKTRAGKVKKFRGTGFIYRSAAEVNIAVYSIDWRMPDEEYILDYYGKTDPENWYIIEVGIGHFSNIYANNDTLYKRRDAIKDFEKIVSVIDEHLEETGDAWLEQLEDLVIKKLRLYAEDFLI